MKYAKLTLSLVCALAASLMHPSKAVATTADDLAAAIKPTAFRFFAGTTGSQWEYGWLDCDWFQVKVAGASTPIGYTTIPVSSVLTCTTLNDSKYYYDTPMTNLDALAWVKDQYSPPGAPWKVVGTYYALDPNSSGQTHTSSGWQSDWRTPKSSLTNDDYNWCHNMWCILLKREATATTPAEAMLWAVPFANGNGYIHYYGMRTILRITNALPGIAITANPATTTENTATKTNTPGKIILTNTISNPFSPAFDVACYWQVSPPNLNNAFVKYVSVTGTIVEPRTTDSTSPNSFLVHFPAATATQSLLVSATNDSLYQPNETVTATLLGGNSYTFDPANNSASVKVSGTGGRIVAEYNVSLSDFAKATGVNQPGSVVETAAPDPVLNSDSIKVKTDKVVTSAPLAVYYQVGGTAVPSRYTVTPSTGVVFIPVGGTTATITVTAVLDRIAYDPGTVRITLLAPADNSYYTPLPGQGDAKTAIVYDDDDNHVSIITDNATAIRGGTNAVFRLVRTGSNVEPMDVGLSISGLPKNGVDYLPLIPATASFPAGVKQITFSENMPNDGKFHRTGAVTVTAKPGLPYRLDSPSSTTILFTDPNAPQSVTINGVIISGAGRPEDAVNTALPGGVTVTGGVVALGGGHAPIYSGSNSATVIPDQRYENGTWIPPVTPYGIDVRIKSVDTGAK